MQPLENYFKWTAIIGWKNLISYNVRLIKEKLAISDQRVKTENCTVGQRIGNLRLASITKENRDPLIQEHKYFASHKTSSPQEVIFTVGILHKNWSNIQRRNLPGHPKFLIKSALNGQNTSFLTSLAGKGKTVSKKEGFRNYTTTDNYKTKQNNHNLWHHSVTNGNSLGSRIDPKHFMFSLLARP